LALQARGSYNLPKLVSYPVVVICELLHLVSFFRTPNDRSGGESVRNVIEEVGCLLVVSQWELASWAVIIRPSIATLITVQGSKNVPVHTGG